MLCNIFLAVAVGAALMWLRLHYLGKLAKSLHNSFSACKATVLAHNLDSDVRNSNSVVALMGDLKRVHRFRDVRQVSLCNSSGTCRQLYILQEQLVIAMLHSWCM